MFGNEVLDRADENLRTLLLPHLGTVTLPMGRVVHRSGTEVETVYFPTTALLSGLRSTSGGRRVATEMVGRFEASGLLAALSASPAPSDVMVQISGSAIVLPASGLRALAHDHPSLMDHLLKVVAQAADRGDVKTACALTHDTHQRLCCWLLEATNRAPHGRLELTQQGLADALGVQRTTVNAAAMVLKQAGTVRYSRGGVEVVDLPALRAQSCDCYDSLERSYLAADRAVQMA